MATVPLRLAALLLAAAFVTACSGQPRAAADAGNDAMMSGSSSGSTSSSSSGSGSGSGSGGVACTGCCSPSTAHVQVDGILCAPQLQMTQSCDGSVCAWGVEIPCID